MKHAIDVQNLSYHYPPRRGEQTRVLANRDITLAVAPGEIFGLLGPNGAGKTTLVMQIIGVLRPSSGRILLNGVDVAQFRAQSRCFIGFLPQQSLSLQTLTVSQALSFTGCWRGMSEAAARRQAALLLENFELTEMAFKRIRELSGGNRRLVMFACALMGDAPVIVLDELTNELDPEHRRMVWNYIHQLNLEKGLTFFLITHNLLEAERVVHRVAVMRDGQIEQIGTPGAIKQQVSAAIQFDLWLKQPMDLSGFLENICIGEYQQPRSGHYRFYLPKETAARTVDYLTQHIGFEVIDDFRLAFPSLEDVYLAIQ